MPFKFFNFPLYLEMYFVINLLKGLQAAHLRPLLDPEARVCGTMNTSKIYSKRIAGEAR